MIRLAFLLLLAPAAAAQERCPLPPIPAGPPESVEVGVRVEVQASGDLLLDGAPADAAVVDHAVRAHARMGRASAISFETDRDLDYAAYVRALDLIKDAFVEERDRKLRLTFKRPYAELTCDEKDAAGALVPFGLILAEPGP